MNHESLLSDEYGSNTNIVTGGFHFSYNCLQRLGELQLGSSAIITAPTGASCTPATQSGGTTITCSGSGIAANGTHTYSITVTASADPETLVCGPVVNTVNGGDGVWNPDMKSASSTISFNCPSLETFVHEFTG